MRPMKRISNRCKQVIQMIKTLKKKVAEYDAAISMLILAITESNDKAKKYME